MVRGSDRKVLVISRSANANQTGDDDGGESRHAPSGVSTRGSGASMMTNKVIFRHLPPTLSVDDFLAIVSPLPEHRYFHYCKADYSAGAEAAFCRAYVGLRRLDDVYSVCSKWDGYEFSDAKGYQYPCLVEFAPNQRIPDRTADGSYQFLAPESDAIEKSAVPCDPLLAKKPRKQNTLKGSLIDDDDFKLFCDKLTVSRSAFVSAANDQPVAPEQMLKEIEDRHKEEDDVSKKKSPLVEFLERRRGNETRRILQKSGGRSDRRGPDLPSSGGGQQKKKRRDRRRERGAKGSNVSAAPGSIKIATKPSAKGEESESHQTKEETQHQAQNKNRPASQDQQRRQQQSSRSQQQVSLSKPQQTPKQQASDTPSRNKQENKSSLPVVPPGQNLRFVDTGDDDSVDERNNNSSKQQRSGNSASKASINRGGGSSSFQQQKDRRRYHNAPDSDTKQSSGSGGGSRGDFDMPKPKTSDQRDFQSPREDDFDYEEKRSGSASKTSSTARPASSGHSVDRTMVFSRSLAAAQRSTSAATGQAVRFDPRKAPLPK